MSSTTEVPVIQDWLTLRSLDEARKQLDNALHNVDTAQHDWEQPCRHCDPLLLVMWHINKAKHLIWDLTYDGERDEPSLPGTRVQILEQAAKELQDQRHEVMKAVVCVSRVSSNSSS
jgi:hypothetical protein